MAVRTVFTEEMKVEHPIVSAPMGGEAGVRWRRRCPAAAGSA
jgi:hypothetical protein